MESAAMKVTCGAGAAGRVAMKRLQQLDHAVVIAGVLSSLGLLGFFAALHDIYHDFASPELWARAGLALPSWYSPVNRTPLEWGMVQAGFLVVGSFHVLLFIRYAARTAARRTEARAPGSKSTLTRWLDGAVGAVGVCSSFSLLAFFLALHDIYQDYASPEVWVRAGQAPPSWFTPGNRTPGEWGVLQIGFLVLVAFHLLLLARLVARTGVGRTDAALAKNAGE
jgi:hypothetical protein